jgi:hypothetical protein
LTFAAGGFEEGDGAYSQFGQTAYEIAETIALWRCDGDREVLRRAIVDELRGLHAESQIVPPEGDDGGRCTTPGTIREAHLIPGH